MDTFSTSVSPEKNHSVGTVTVGHITPLNFHLLDHSDSSGEMGRRDEHTSEMPLGLMKIIVCVKNGDPRQRTPSCNSQKHVLASCSTEKKMKDVEDKGSKPG